MIKEVVGEFRAQRIDKTYFSFRGSSILVFWHLAVFFVRHKSVIITTWGRRALSLNFRRAHKTSLLPHAIIVCVRGIETKPRSNGPTRRHSFSRRTSCARTCLLVWTARNYYRTNNTAEVKTFSTFTSATNCSSFTQIKHSQCGHTEALIMLQLGVWLIAEQLKFFLHHFPND